MALCLSLGNIQMEFNLAVRAEHTAAWYSVQQFGSLQCSAAVAAALVSVAGEEAVTLERRSLFR